jgi:DnaJ-class molecular chaperone
MPPPEERPDCTTCYGRGEIWVEVVDPPDKRQGSWITCPVCRGTGKR